MTNKTELKPCPFCGGEAEVFMDSWDNPNPGYSGGQGKRVKCKSCGSVGEWIHVDYFNWFSQHSVEDFRRNNSLRVSLDEKYENYVKEKELLAIKSWNTRPQEPSGDVSKALEPLDEGELTKFINNLDNGIVEEYSPQLLAKSICQRFGKPNIDEVLKEFREAYDKYWEGCVGSYPEFNHHNNRMFFESFLSEKLR